ncbi:MAG: hypothetical protein ACRC1M_06660 [Methanobacteriaceae archaeon]
MNRKKTALEIEVDTHNRLKKVAIDKGITLTDLINDVLLESVEKLEKE